MDKITEKHITDAINANYSGNSKYRIANAFIFRGDWESDFFVMKNNGYCYEFEVKISRSDFFSDLKKTNKHLSLSVGKRIQKTFNFEAKGKEDRYINEEVACGKRPNRFFYVVPSNLVTTSEVPEYAGLMYYTHATSQVMVVKNAPFIHKEIVDLDRELCSKFYHRWQNAKIENRSLSQMIDVLRYDINSLKSKYES